MSKLVAAFATAAGKTLISESERVAENRKLAKLETLRKARVDREHELSLERETVSQANRMASAGYAHELSQMSKEPHRVTTDNGIYERTDDGTYSKLNDDEGNALIPRSKATTDKLNPAVKISVDRMKAIEEMRGLDGKLPDGLQDEYDHHQRVVYGATGYKGKTSKAKGGSSDAFQDDVDYLQSLLDDGKATIEEVRKRVEGSGMSKPAVDRLMNALAVEKGGNDADLVPAEETTAEAAKKPEAAPAQETGADLIESESVEKPESTGDHKKVLDEVSTLESEIRHHETLIAGYTNKDGAAARHSKQKIRDIQRKRAKIMRSEEYKNARRIITERGKKALSD